MADYRTNVNLRRLNPESRIGRGPWTLGLIFTTPFYICTIGRQQTKLTIGQKLNFLPRIDTIGQTTKISNWWIHQCKAWLTVLINTIGIGPSNNQLKIKPFFLWKKNKEKPYFFGPLLRHIYKKIHKTFTVLCHGNTWNTWLLLHLYIITLMLTDCQF